MKKNLIIALAGLAVLSLGACSKQESAAVAPVADGGAGPAAAAVELITDSYLREIIKEISDDRYEGRGPSTPGDIAARKYLIGRMQEMGLKPGAADGGWEQPFDMISVDTHTPESWEFARDGQTVSLKFYDDFVLLANAQQARIEVDNAELVFAGYGIQAPEFDWDDYKDVDVKGKIVILMNNDPDWDPDLFAGETRLWYGRWDYKFENAARNGAIGAIIIHTTPSAGYPFQVLQTSNTGPQMELPVGDEPRNQFKSFMTEDATRALIELAGMDLDALREAAYNRDFRPVPLGITTSVTADVSIDSVQTANVLGLIPGSDPVLKDEVVIFSAHHDHLGIGPADAEGDTIYNGAMDNASGVAEVLAMARAYMALPSAPRRSILICLVGAEEQGLLGSKWYASHPTFHPGKIAANLNFDGGNLHGLTKDITYVGFGKTSIDEDVIKYAAEQGRIVKPDQFADRGYFYRSDQFSFAKIGVPAVYLEPGTDYVDRPEGWGRQKKEEFEEHNYHQPSDEYDPNWNLAGMIQDTQVGFWIGLAVANADAMPTWNVGDEFEARRLEALATAGEQ